MGLGPSRAPFQLPLLLRPEALGPSEPQFLWLSNGVDNDDSFAGGITTAFDGIRGRHCHNCSTCPS